MSHFTTTTPTMCAFLLFTPCAFHSHPHPHKWCSCDGLSNGVLSHSTNAMCHPPLSLQHNHTLTLASHHNRHTPCGKCHHTKCQTPRHSHCEGHSADAYTQRQGRCAQYVGCSASCGPYGCVDCMVSMCGCSLLHHLSHQAINSCE